jgi:hypothetical protein
VCATLLVPSQGLGELFARISLGIVVVVVLFLVPWNDPCMLLLLSQGGAGLQKYWRVL